MGSVALRCGVDRQLHGVSLHFPCFPVITSSPVLKAVKQCQPLKEAHCDPGLCIPGEAPAAPSADGLKLLPFLCIRELKLIVLLDTLLLSSHPPLPWGAGSL